MQRPASRRIPHPRRDFLGIGGLSALGLSLADLTACGAGRRGLAAEPERAARAKSCMILFLAGGPPQHETFDPKPDAPGEIRGEFRPASTNVPGIQFCELLPLTARHADKMCVIRSMTTGIHSHSASGAFMLTGLAPQNLAENVPASPQDWPSIAATVGALRPATRSPLSSVILPEPIVNNPAIPWPGQDGGFMGGRWHPQLLRCDPAAPHIEIDGLESPAELASGRLEDRRRLLDRLDARFREAQANPAMHDLDHMHHQAFSLLDAGRTRDALQIERESAAVRDRYGRHKFGQSVLLGRRLLEAGVRLVQVNYPREPGDTTASNPLWDTHADNAARLRDVLCPSFDRPFAALLEDLASSGMLAETLVVVMGEFGRTPKINARGGRDHWGSVFSVALAGGCVPGGAVIGASDRLGAMPAERPVRPADLAATIFQLLGIPPGAEFHDALGRPRAVTTGGTPLREIVG